MKYSDVKWMLNHGQDVAKEFGDIQPSGHIIGSYWPSQSNWAYQFVIVKFNGKVYEVMTQFGSVVGGRRLYLYENNSEEQVL